MLSQYSYINRINVIKRTILRERMSWLYFNHDIESSTAIIKAVLCESFYYHCVINLQQKLQRNQQQAYKSTHLRFKVHCCFVRTKYHTIRCDILLALNSFYCEQIKVHLSIYKRMYAFIALKCKERQVGVRLAEGVLRFE